MKSEVMRQKPSNQLKQNSWLKKPKITLSYLISKLKASDALFFPQIQNIALITLLSLYYLVSDAMCYSLVLLSHLTHSKVPLLVIFFLLYLNAPLLFVCRLSAIISLSFLFACLIFNVYLFLQTLYPFYIFLIWARLSRSPSSPCTALSTLLFNRASILFDFLQHF